MGSNALPEIKKFKYKSRSRKDKIPALRDAPIQGIKSDKNYIKSNIVEAVSMGNRKLKTEKNWTKKKNYGKVPKYLEREKKRIKEEYEYIRGIQQGE